jgi:hypothetical protein
MRKLKILFQSSIYKKQKGRPRAGHALINDMLTCFLSAATTTQCFSAEYQYLRKPGAL